MKEVVGNIWKLYDNVESYVVIPTNGSVTVKGDAVMGRGLARDTAKLWPSMPSMLANRLKFYGNRVHIFTQYRIITFPVKRYWFELANMELIEQSLGELVLLSVKLKDPTIYVPRVGCGNGKLSWIDVKQVIAKHLIRNNFVVVSQSQEEVL